MRPLKVNIVAGDIVGGGGEKWVRKFYEANRSNFQIRILLFGRSREFIFDEIYIYPSQRRFKKRIFKTILKFFWLVCNSRGQNWILASGMFNILTIPIIVFFGSPNKVIVRETNLPAQYNNKLKYFYRILNLANKVIAQSIEMERQLLMLGVKAKMIKIIHNPIDFESTVLEKNQDLSELRLAYIGRYTYQKGTDRILRAISENRLTKYSIINFFGSGDIEIESNEKIIDHGWNSSINWDEFDILLFPSRWEGMPNIILEAIANGKPVIAAKWKGGYEELSGFSNIYFLESGWNESIDKVIDDILDSFDKSRAYKNMKELNLRFNSVSIYKKWGQLLKE